VSRPYKSICRGGSPPSRPYKWRPFVRAAGGCEPPLQMDLQGRLSCYSTRIPFVRTGDILVRPKKIRGVATNRFCSSDEQREKGPRVAPRTGDSGDGQTLAAATPSFPPRCRAAAGASLRKPAHLARMAAARPNHADLVAPFDAARRPRRRSWR
jgi:hypothetical protein